MKHYIISIFLLFITAINLLAEVKLPSIFKSDMVLQRDTVVSIWGWAEPKEKITIRVGKDKFSGRANMAGEWRVEIGPYKAGGPHKVIVSGTNEIILENVLFGEVWLCGGQSNMQYTLRWLDKNLDEIPGVENNMIRFFQGQLDMDYLPKNDLKGGEWKIASKETVPDFSAVAYYFGKFLYDSLQVPIGLISINQGATTIETWMSKKSLEQFPQFKNVVDNNVKSFNQLNEELAEFRKEWDEKYYLKGPGFEQEWYRVDTDVSEWGTMKIPTFWEYEGIDHDGAVWFRKEFDLPEGFDSDAFVLGLNQIDDYDITWVNGEKVGETFGNRNFRTYFIPKNILKEKGNVLVVRVFDVGGVGGMYTSAFWGNPVLVGEWKYKKGLDIDPEKFPIPVVPNGSLFSYPTLLYNGSIAPITPFTIKGVIWYQGESNAQRAEEYKQLLPAMIRDWRRTWGYNFPFLIVQLANYGQEPETPTESNWAELREAQHGALQEPSTFIATAIDIGEADDIHPHNKEEVGRRLGLGALKIAYDRNIVAESPQFKEIVFRDNTAIVEFSNVGEGLITKNKYGYIRGFQIAGEDKKFYWAKAELKDNEIIVSSTNVKDPVSVRYAWADNPGELDLYNRAGLPLLPFRTDDWKGVTSEKVYSDDPHQF